MTLFGLLPGVVLPLISTDGQAGKETRDLCLIKLSVLSLRTVTSHNLMTRGDVFQPTLTTDCLKPSDKLRLLTGRGGLAHKGHQLLFNHLEGVQVVHEEDVSVAGFAGDAHQLPVVSISEADGKHNVALTGREREGEETIIFNVETRRRRRPKQQTFRSDFRNMCEECW